MIKAEIETPDKSKNKGYQGNILLEHKDAYRVNVSGYVNYFSPDIGADFDVSYELLSTNGPPKSQVNLIRLMRNFIIVFVVLVSIK